MAQTRDPAISFVLPAQNEAAGLRWVLPRLRERYPDAEIVVVDDASCDDTGEVARGNGATVIRHPCPMGNGAAVKAGARAARGARLVLMDADGQHDPADTDRLLAALDQGYSMAIGARGPSGHASIARRLANGVYNRFASYVAEHRVKDLTSGFRAADRKRFCRYLHLLPNGFSYPTTITMVFMRAGFPVAFVPASIGERIGTSHIRPLRDGVRFLLIIFRIATLYSPLKIFAPCSAALVAIGVGYYGYTFWAHHTFTTGTAVLILAGALTFLGGLISEQISALTVQAEE